MENFFFGNSGKKIKKLVFVFFLALMIITICVALFQFGMSFLMAIASVSHENPLSAMNAILVIAGGALGAIITLIGGFLAAWLPLIFVYGFGEIISRLASIDEKMEERDAVTTDKSYDEWCEKSVAKPSKKASENIAPKQEDMESTVNAECEEVTDTPYIPDIGISKNDENA